ncbi:MAG: GNAT family N-acetyltransferase [Ignavibacterium sp.]|nr:MAG: GNAT family N-acetyltransferase [Ignavibacterium sp.]
MLIDLGGYQIRSYKLSDKDALIKYANNQNVAKNLRDSFPFPYTEKDAVKWLNLSCIQNPELNYAIANLEELIGGIGLLLQPDVYRYSAEVGYWLAEPFWGKGIATKALIAFTNYAFKQFNLVRLFAGAFDGNEPSVKVLEKAGYKYEGRYRKAIYKDDEFKDQLMYGILKEEITN